MKNRSIVILSILIICYLVMGVLGIFRMSLTFDELAHIPAGYTYCAENDFRMNSPDHPPLAKMVAAVPLLFLKPLTFTHHEFWETSSQWRYGDLFIYHNRIKPYVIINAARIMLLGISVLLGIVIFLWGRNIGNECAGLIGAGLFYFFPGFISHGGLVTTDVPMALCYFFAVYRFWKMYEHATFRNAVFLGLGIGMTLAVKFSGILIFPSLALLTFRWIIRKRMKIQWKEVSIHILVILFFAGLVLAVAYRFIHLDWYIYGLKNVLSQVGEGRGSFLLGNYSVTGWWYYFPVTFLLKTPMGIIFLSLLSIGLMPRLWSSEKGRDALLFLAIPAAVYFISAARSPMQIGHRHILPVYPFLFTIIGWAGIQCKGKLKILPGIGVLATLISVVVAQPYNLEYFNILISPREKAYQYLVDSNLDWGQGLKELGKYLQKIPNKQVFLSYFGTADPYYEGIDYIPVLFYTTVKRKGATLKSLKGKRILFAISATQRQCVYYTDRNIFRWLDDIEPIQVIAYSIFVYDLTENTEGLIHLRKLLERLEHKAAEVIGDVLPHDAAL